MADEEATESTEEQAAEAAAPAEEAKEDRFMPWTLSRKEMWELKIRA